MGEWGSEGHMRRQLFRSRPHYGQRRKLSHLDEASKQRCHEGIENFFLMDFSYFVFKQQDSERAWKGNEEEEKGGFGVCKSFDTTVSTPSSSDSEFENKPVSSLLDLASESPSSMMAISKWYLIRKRWIRGQRVTKTSLKATQLRGKNKPTQGRFPPECSRKTPSLAKKKETEGVCCLKETKSTINGDLKYRKLTRMKLGVFESFRLQTERLKKEEKEENGFSKRKKRK